MNDKYYILDGKEAVPADLMTWASWFERSKNDRIVAKTIMGNVTVSTVFLGLDHRFGDGPPLLFETLVFEGPLEGEMDRYSTYAEALAGHNSMVSRVAQAHDEERSDEVSPHDGGQHDTQ